MPDRADLVWHGGRARFSVEIAATAEQRARGLMFRQEMAAGAGMLFVYARPQHVAFWMKNTPMPLDVGFIGQDGRIAAILQGEPQSLAVISPGVPVRFVLELKAGTAARQGIADGDAVKISTKGNVLTFNGKPPQTAEIAQFEAPVPKRKLN